MPRDCTSACVSYVTANEFSNGVKELGMSEMHCMRLFLDLAEMMNMRQSFDDEDFDDEEEI